MMTDGDVSWWATIEPGGCRVSPGEDGLPVMSWEEGNRYVRSWRRCSVVRAREGLLFVHEWHSAPVGWVRGMTRVVGFGASLLGNNELLDPDHEERREAPWVALQGFRLTDNQTYLGAPRMRRVSGSGEQVPIEPARVLVAEFGQAAPAMVVSVRDGSEQTVAMLHGLLLREFIEGRVGHLARLERGGVDASGVGEARPREL